MSGPLAGRIAVITGGASGIGESTARLLAARGAVPVIADLAEVPAKALADELGGHAVVLDVTDADATERIAEFVDREVGPVDVLVTSAGVSQRPTRPEDFAIEDWDTVMRVDVRGTYVSAVAFGTRMARRGRGSIITIASVTALRSTPLHAYGPGKAAVVHLTANLAAEWGRSNVRVNCVVPGYTRTPMVQAMIDRGERDASVMERNAALGRMVEADEVASAIAFLAGDDSTAITGITLPVDAGWLVTSSWQTYGGLPAARLTEEPS